MSADPGDLFREPPRHIGAAELAATLGITVSQVLGEAAPPTGIKIPAPVCLDLRGQPLWDAQLAGLLSMTIKLRRLNEAEQAADDAIATAAGSTDPVKHLATLRARAAIQGIQLHAMRGDDGRPEYVATKWALTTAFRDLGDVERWLDRVEGKRPA